MGRSTRPGASRRTLPSIGCFLGVTASAVIERRSGRVWVRLAALAIRAGSVTKNTPLFALKRGHHDENDIILEWDRKDSREGSARPPGHWGPSISAECARRERLPEVRYFRLTTHFVPLPVPSSPGIGPARWSRHLMPSDVAAVRRRLWLFWSKARLHMHDTCLNIRAEFGTRARSGCLWANWFGTQD